MYSNPEQFTEAFNVATGEQHTVPLNFLDKDGPYAGQWRKTDPKHDTPKAARQNEEKN